MTDIVLFTAQPTEGVTQSLIPKAIKIACGSLLYVTQRSKLHVFSLSLAGDFRGLFDWMLKAALLLTNPGGTQSTGPGPGLVLLQTRLWHTQVGDILKLCGFSFFMCR